MLGVVGVVAAAYGVHATLRLRIEEAAGRSEALLATGVGRVRWAASHLLVAMVGTTGLVLTAGLAAAAARAVQAGGLTDSAGVVGGALLQLPAIWVVMGIAMAAFGVGSRYAMAGWIALDGLPAPGGAGAPSWTCPNASSTCHRSPTCPGCPGPPSGPCRWSCCSASPPCSTGAGLVGLRRRDID